MFLTDIEEKMLDGRCDSCDLDPAQCHLAGYCAYEQEDEDEL